MRWFCCFVLAAALTTGGLAMAQTSGSIDGTVRDAQGLVLPGASVTLTGAAVLGQRTAATVEDGTYRFRDLRPGSYNILYELSGFQTLNREGIIVETGKLVTVNVNLNLATVSETVTVTGESPVVDVKNTRLGGSFDTAELQDVPSATDVWAVLGQTPGIRMLGFDVGGSHKSQQTGYESFGIRGQARVLSDGVDSTEGTGGTGFYYDYYSVEEFQVSAGGADVTMNSPGAAVIMTLKSGGNELSGLYHLDYEGESMVGDNSDADTEARGYTGNPVLLFWEGHADLGGPIVKDKAWFYATYNHFKIDKAISGVSRDVSTDLGIFDNFGGKITLQATEKDQIILYSQWGNKQKPNRGLSLTRPPESIRAQDSWSWITRPSGSGSGTTGPSPTYRRSTSASSGPWFLPSTPRRTPRGATPRPASTPAPVSRAPRFRRSPSRVGNRSSRRPPTTTCPTRQEATTSSSGSITGSTAASSTTTRTPGTSSTSTTAASAVPTTWTRSSS